MTVLLRWLFLAVTLLAAILAGWCYPSLYGDTGLVVMPTADIIPNTYYDLAINYAHFPDTYGGSTVYPLRLTYGASDNAELSILLANPTHNADSPDALGGTVKLSIAKEDPYLGHPGLAIGARVFRLHNLPGDAKDRSVVDAYAAVSKRLFGNTDTIAGQGYAVRMHVTVDGTTYSGDETGSFVSGAVGISYQTSSGSNIVADFVPLQKKNGITFRSSAISAAIRYPLSDHFLFELGEAQLFGLGDSNSLYAGILYRYGQRSSSGEYQ